MLFIIIFVFGLIIGSFLNVVILRHNTGESVLNGKSRCLNCGKNLSWREMIPMFSFFVQKGRCKNCRSKISRQYPAVEMITGVMFALIAFKFTNYELRITNYEFLNNLPSVVYYWLIFSILIVISVYDIRHQIIPDKFVYPLAAISLFSVFFQTASYKLQAISFLNNILTGLALFSFFALLWLISRGRWMGFGDAKLALAIGFFLGPAKGLLAFLFSFWLGAIFGVALLIYSKFFLKKSVPLKTQIPFAPFLALAGFLAFLIEMDFYGLVKLTSFY